MELETASVQTAGPVESPKVSKSEKETVLLEPTQEEPKAEEEPKPVVLELSKAEDAKATEPAVIQESPEPIETTPITSENGAATSESLEKTTTEATEPSGTESTVKAAEPQATAVEAVASDNVDSTSAQTPGAEATAVEAVASDNVDSTAAKTPGAESTDSGAAATTIRPPVPKVDDDESDDDLDDLDDMLDEFDVPSPQAAPAANPGATASGTTAEPIDEDWAAQLQAGMADLLNDMNETPEMKEQFDVLAKELNEAMAASAAAGSSKTAEKLPPSVADAANSANFQDKIKQAMERMQASEADVGQAVADTEGEDFLAEMMKQLGGSGEGGAGEEDFSGMLVNMMEQLTSREVLYEPMKELSEKYPSWIERNEGKTPKAEMDKYKGQYTIVKQIVTKFEEPGYKDENEVQRQYIIDCMQKMQDAGAPPTELMGDMQQDMEAPDVAPNCGVQ